MEPRVMLDLYKKITVSQTDAALAMLNQCIERCPDQHWDGLIAKYPFWMVAYHTLCFTDLYLSPGDATFQPRKDLHPAGMAEFDDEYPSCKFSKQELLGYVEICRRKLSDALAQATSESLAGPTGFARRKFTRAELHLYNLRHIMHHTGQLSAFLRRVGVDTDWASVGHG
jgi:hypothetical protein